MPRVEQKWTRIARSIVLAGAVIAVAGCSLLPEEDTPLAPPLVKPVDATVRTVEVKLGTIEYAVHGTGTLESKSSEYVQLEESGGIVDEVFVQAGDEVKAGDLLMQLEKGNLDLDVLKKQLDVKKKEIALKAAKDSGDEDVLQVALLELHIATEELNQLDRRLRDTMLHAPIDGVVTYDSGVEPGDRVEQFQVLYTISDPNDLRVAFTTPLEAAKSEIVVGTVAEVDFDGDIHTGVVVQTPASAPFVDNERLKEKYAGTIFIEMDSMPEDATIGNWGDVKIVLRSKEDTIVLPKRALRQNFGRSYVQILEGETRREIDVETGIETQTEIEILKGLEIGQQVVMP